MNKRISAAFVVMLFMLGIVAVPVQAHFTLGQYTSTYRYHAKDFDYSPMATYGHVGGLIGYVWPGAGPYSTPSPGWYTGFSTYPGYQTIFPGGKPYPLSGPMGWYQAESNNYAPFGAILTSTILAGTDFAKVYVSGNPTIEGLPIEHEVRGDLIFAVNATANVTGTTGWPAKFQQIEIWIPPEFKGITKENIVASFTNDWGNIGSTSVYDKEDQIVPKWTRIRVRTDRMLPVYTGKYMVFGNSTLGDTWYYVRVNNVIAPTIAGKYFFKIGLTYVRDPAPDGASGVTGYGYRTATVWLGNPFANNYTGVYNFPVLLVKGEVDPAVIDGTIRYGGWNTAYYGSAIELAGRVRAVGRAIDPATLKPTARPVEARGYFNSTAKGHYEVEGVAPGIYDIYASAAGYPETKIASGVMILKGQSYHLDGYLSPGVVVKGTVYSKCGTGEVSWICTGLNSTGFPELKSGYWSRDPATPTSTQDIKIEIYKTQADAEATAYDTETKAVSWSPTDDMTPPYWINSKQNQGGEGWGHESVSFPWPGYGGLAAKGLWTTGVGPAQTWQVESTKASFKFQFGDKGLYGTPTEWSGHVPQRNATWVDGLPAGTYFVRAWTNGYVQTAADGVTFEHVPFTVASVEWPGDVEVAFDLRLSSYIVKIVHFHDLKGTLTETAPPTGRELVVEALDAAGKIAGWRVLNTYTGYLYGTWPIPAAVGVPIRGMVGLSGGWGGGVAWGFGRNYGLLAGAYKVKAYLAGYVETPPTEQITIGLCGSKVELSDHLHKGATFNFTFYSKDWEHPTVDKPWPYKDEYIYTQIWKDGKQLIPTSVGLALTTFPRVAQGYGYSTPLKTYANLLYYGSNAYYTNLYAEGLSIAYPQYKPLSFSEGLYSFKGLTYGYIQTKPFQLYATEGSIADIPIKLVQGVNVTLNIKFKKEGLFEHLRFNSTMRIRILDETGKRLLGEFFTSQQVNKYSPVKVQRYTGGLYEHLNFVPRSTTELALLICSGLPDAFVSGYGTFYGYNGFDRAFAGLSALPGYSDTRTFGATMEDRGPSGIPGFPEYKGGYIVEVEIVPFGNEQNLDYPPPPGLLYGESTKYLPVNHIGPYEMRKSIVLPNGHLGGEVSAIFEVDLLGLLQGAVYGYTWCDDWRSASWMLVQASGAPGTFNYFTFDGRYEIYLPRGTWTLQVTPWSPKGEAFKGYAMPIVISDGQVGAMDVFLEQSGIPIPEFPVAAIVLASALAASLFILRRRRKQ